MSFLGLVWNHLFSSGVCICEHFEGRIFICTFLLFFIYSFLSCSKHLSVLFWTCSLCLLSSQWWSEAQEKKRLVSDPRHTKVKKKLKNLKLHPGFPNPAVAQAYLQPAVDQSDSSFSWGRPQLDMIKEYPFCLSL